MGIEVRWSFTSFEASPEPIPAAVIYPLFTAYRCEPSA